MQRACRKNGVPLHPGNALIFYKSMTYVFLQRRQAAGLQKDLQRNP